LYFLCGNHHFSRRFALLYNANVQPDKVVAGLISRYAIPEEYGIDGVIGLYVLKSRLAVPERSKEAHHRTE